MKRIFIKSIFFLIIFTLTSFIFTKSSFAAVTATITTDPSTNPPYVDLDTKSVTVTTILTGTDLTAASKEECTAKFFCGKPSYTFGFFHQYAPDEKNGSSCLNRPGKDASFIDSTKVTKDGQLVATFTLMGQRRQTGTWFYSVWKGSGCPNYKSSSIILKGSFNIYPPGGNSVLGQPAIKPAGTCSNFPIGSSQDFLLQNIEPNKNYTVWIDGNSKNPPVQFSPDKINNSSGQPTATYSINVGTEVKDKTRVCVAVGDHTGCDFSADISIVGTASNTCAPVTQNNQPGFTIDFAPDQKEPPAPPPPCEEGLDANGNTVTVLSTDSPTDKATKEDQIITCTKVSTAIGSIGTKPEEFVSSIFKLLLGISGGIALILIVTSGYKLMASQGNPEQVQGARETLTSAIVGLLFIIFSFVLLQIIGVNILHIPGFG